MRKRLFVLIALVMAVALVVAGCAMTGNQPDRKNVPKAGEGPLSQIPGTNNEKGTDNETATPRDSTLTRETQEPVTESSLSESRKLADKLTKQVVKVDGVSSAAIVIQPANNKFSALVGATLDSNVEGESATAIKNEITTTIKKADNRITKVMVTTNPDLIKRIEDIARGVLAGKPIQSFADEITDLTKRIAPTLK
ncbi:MAG: YhcN/YlaJ family sporulation lipoprotein [Syntrophomonadaceae bacterium]|nr:YhcN/YlaJ family sporulation lipoprotein [Syntrophomonadaceae bacterium]